MIAIVVLDAKKIRLTYMKLYYSFNIYQLQTLNVNTIYVGGLALDYCVLFTVLDAIKLGYKVKVLKDCT